MTRVFMRFLPFAALSYCNSNNTVVWQSIYANQLYCIILSKYYHIIIVIQLCFYYVSVILLTTKIAFIEEENEKKLLSKAEA